MTTLFYDDEVAAARAHTDVVDLFSGPRGWSEGLRMIAPDVRDVGLESCRWANATARAAGHVVVECDVSAVDPADYLGATGLIASPPCQAFSAAGKQHGRQFVDELLAAIDRGDWTVRPHPDPNVWLVLEVGRWIDALDPEWIACEQVPAVLPLWERYAERLERAGYRVWCGKVNAADYGVPQTRERAILLASRTRTPTPRPTHHRDGADGRARWVTMAEALGADRVDEIAETLNGRPRVGFPRLDDRGDSGDGYRDRDWRSIDEPSFALTEKARSWIVRTGQNTETAAGLAPYERSLDDPAPVVTSQARSWIVDTGRDWDTETQTGQQFDPADRPAPAVTAKSGGQWHLIPNRLPNAAARSLDEPAPTIAFGHAACDWVFARPATTVAGDARLWPPGHKVNADDVARLGADEAARRYGDRAGSEAIRLTIRDALVLQSFRPDYPVRGTRTRQFEQIGNAVPPLLAAHLLAAVLDLPVPSTREAHR